MTDLKIQLTQEQENSIVKTLLKGKKVKFGNLGKLYRDNSKSSVITRSTIDTSR